PPGRTTSTWRTPAGVCRITAPEGVRTSLTRPSGARRTMPPLAVRVTTGGRPAVLLLPNTRPPGGGFIPGRVLPFGAPLRLPASLPRAGIPEGRLLLFIVPGAFPGREFGVLPNPPRPVEPPPLGVALCVLGTEFGATPPGRVLPLPGGGPAGR